MSSSCTGASGKTGTLYNYAELEGLWINAGGRKTLAPIMAAIAMAESSGCSAAYNPSGASGLWQVECPINAQYVPGGCGNVFSPSANASAAVAIWKAQGLDAWQTYTSGAYKAFVSGSTTPDTNVPSSDGGASAPTTATLTAADTNLGNTCLVGIPNALSNVPVIGGLFSQDLVCFFRKTEARALIGGLMIAAGGVTVVVSLGIVIVGVLGHTGAGKAVGTAAEGAGAALAFVPGAELAGAAIAAGGSAVKHRKGAGAKVAQGRKTRRQQNSSEDQELQARGASDIRTARRPQPRPSKPGRVTGSMPGPGRNETSRQRSRRYASANGSPASQEEAGF